MSQLFDSNVPDDLHYRKLRYPGTCKQCVARLPEGSDAWWSPSKVIICANCIPAPTTSVPLGSPASLNITRTRSPSQDEWEALVGYLHDCVSRESIENTLTSKNKGSQWIPVKADYRKLIADTTQPLALDKKAADFVANATDQELLMLGWPFLKITNPDNSDRVVPVLLLSVTGKSLEDEIHLQATEALYVNPEIMDHKIFDASTGDSLFAVAEQAMDAKALNFNDLLVALRSVTGEADDEHQKMPPAADTLCVVDQVILFKSAETVFTKKLLGELACLKDKTDWTTTAAALLINGLSQAQLSKTQIGPALSPLALNESQEQALLHIRTDPLTVVTGQPGTGKSHLVAAVAVSAWLDDDSILISSTNNGAVDVACRGANKIAEAALIRTGANHYRDELPGIIKSALALIPEEDAWVDQAVAMTSRAEAVADATRRTIFLEALEQRCSLEVTLNQQSEALLRSERALWHQTPPALELDARLAKRVRKVNHAVFFRRQRQTKLLQQKGIDKLNAFPLLLDWSNTYLTILNLKKSLCRAEVSTPPEDDQARLRELEKAWLTSSRAAFLSTYANLMRRGSGCLSAIGDGAVSCRSITSATNFAKGWGCTTLAVGSNFDLKPGIFDLVVIDEASQCALAHVLPLAYRAKRLAIIGDPHQLSPIVKLTNAEVDRIALANNLDADDLRAQGRSFKDGSAYTAYEFVLGKKDVRLLDEHYRCHPLIARWFNTAFYDDSLTVLTDVRALVWTEQQALVWTDIAGKAERRGSSWINEAEAVAVVERLEYIASREAAHITAEERKPTVGVVTPFSAQAKYIVSLVQGLGQDVKVGTAHTFQGDERDIMLFSTVLTPNVPSNWVENTRNLINVAVSRARSSLMIFGYPMDGIGGTTHWPTLEGLRLAAKEGSDSVDALRLILSDAERCLYDAMVAAGFTPISKPLESGYELDFALLSTSTTRKVDVEVDGSQHIDQHGRQRRQDLARDQVLRGLGWEVFRVPAWRCYREADLFAEEIRQMMTGT